MISMLLPINCAIWKSIRNHLYSLQLSLLVAEIIVVNFPSYTRSSSWTSSLNAKIYNSTFTGILFVRLTDPLYYYNPVLRCKRNVYITETLLLGFCDTVVHNFNYTVTLFIKKSIILTFFGENTPTRLLSSRNAIPISARIASLQMHHLPVLILRSDEETS